MEAVAERRGSLLIVTQYYLPEMGAPQGRLSELASWLVRAGWSVRVLTALPNYPTGRVFPGYRGRLRVEECVDGVEVVRTWIWPTRSGRALPRLLSYGSFAASAAWAGRAPRPDIVYVESPPLFLGVTARRLARRWHVPYVMNVSDLWPGSFVALGRLAEGSVTFRMLARLERSLYDAAGAVTCQSEGIALSVRNTSPGAVVEVISNGADPSRFGRERATPEARGLLGGEDGVTFVYAGLFGFAQGLAQVLDAARLVRDRADIRIVLAGDGPLRRRLEAEVARAGLDRVVLLPAQRRDLVPALLASADAALVTLERPIPGAVPSKVYEAMASSLPIVYCGGGEPASLIEAARAGICVAAGDVRGLATAMRELADRPELRAELGEAGRRAVLERYSRDKIAKRLDRLLIRVLDTANSH